MTYLKIPVFLLVCFLFIISLQGQSLDGVYSDGVVSLHLEERENDVHGWFADKDGNWYEASFTSVEEGLIGTMDRWMVFIPWDTEVMTLVVMSLDAKGDPVMDTAVEFQLNWVSELYTETEQVDYSQITWTPVKRFGVDFYPSYVLATATWSHDLVHETPQSGYAFYGDGNGYFGVNTSNIPVGSVVHVEVEGGDIAKRSAYAVTITQPGVNEIYPIIEYDFDALKKIEQAKPVNFKYAVYINDVFMGEQMEVVWVRSINDAVTIAQDHYGNVYTFPFIFAAYVNENEPQLDPILGKILDYGIIDSWIGYQGSEEKVINQIFALWYHFQKEGFRYSSITTQSGSDERSFGQVVRFVGDAIKTTQANCIDGTVLFASFLYKIGIDVSIVLIPGHAYLAFSIDEAGTQKFALETTMVGSLNFENTSKQDDLYFAMNGKETSIQQSWQAFLGAMEAGTADYYENAVPHLEQQDPNYLEINIGEARGQKIRPIK